MRFLNKISIDEKCKHHEVWSDLVLNEITYTYTENFERVKSINQNTYNFKRAKLINQTQCSKHT